MATRLQSLVMAFSTDKQASIAVPSTSFSRFTKLNNTITTPGFIIENDAPEIGKGNEFISNVFKSHVNVQNSVEKYASSEWLTYVTAYALGDVTVATGTYTIKPLDPALTLELPYFSVVEQIAEGGAEALDTLYVGNQMESFTYNFASGPGRASSKVTCNWVGSGLLTQPSGITVPATTTEHNMLAAGMALTVNGVDYVGTKRVIGGSISWNNNLLLNAGHYPGSGSESGFQTRGRIEIGARSCGFNFSVRAISGSTEYATLKGLTSGTASLTISYDSSNSTSFAFEKMFFQSIEVGESDGLVTFNVTGAPAYDATNGLLTITSKTSLAGIAQQSALAC